ncbi:MAG TPA: glutamate-5-semialdehyde dehydrogenase [Chitinivibrionales bacterium]|nr:glutamate-5-semialdehyde dehydrogenase [Chitinivibrionales bacterium]
MTSLTKTIDAIARKARASSIVLGDTAQDKVDNCLRSLAGLLDAQKDALVKANRKDIALARAKRLAAPMIDRLTLSDKAFESMKKGLNAVADLSTPVGSIFDEHVRPNGLTIYKMKVPIGVIAIIYESRPNVTVDAASLCLKSRNSVILRGGSEAFFSNKALAALIARACAGAGLPGDAVQLVPTTDRKAIDMLLTKDNDIDLVIPRGGEGLIRAVVEKSRIPVIKHYKGVCHVYVSRFADMAKALPIVVNAKVQRPGVCNAMETLLLDKALSNPNKLKILSALVEKGVILYGDPAVRRLVPSAKRATRDDWFAEYLDLRLAVRVVDNVGEAISHINAFGSHHTDAIVTDSKEEADQFVRLVDSSSVMVNASTRFSDGGEYGMGAEIGISTDKLHARGPMGVADLTTYKWVVRGNGQIRS